MASVDLRPGDTLNIVWTSVQDTPLGKKEVESSFAFSYEDLLRKLNTQTRSGTSKRSGTRGAKFSRVVALATNALKKGKWSTGAEIDRCEVFFRLKEKFYELDPAEYSNITENAKTALRDLHLSSHYLEEEQKRELNNMLSKLGD
jgi:hypothetical protein